MPTLQDIYSLLMQIQDKVDNLMSRKVAPNQVAINAGLSDLSESLGMIRAGTYEVTDEAGNTRLILTGDKERVNTEYGVSSHFLGIDNGKEPQIWIDADDGSLRSAGGALSLSKQGIQILKPGIPFLLQSHNLSGDYRIGLMQMDINNTPVLSIGYFDPDITNLCTNPGFETGDLTGWSYTVPSYFDPPFVQDVYVREGSYSLEIPCKEVSSDETVSITSGYISVTAQKQYIIALDTYVQSGIDADLIVKVQWYKSGYTLLSTSEVSFIENVANQTVVSVINTTTSPADSAYAKLVIQYTIKSGSLAKSIFLDEIVFGESDSFHIMRFEDDGVTLNGKEISVGGSSPSLSEIVTITGTSYTTSDSDLGKILRTTSSSRVTITIHSGASAGFYVWIVQDGTGQVKVEAGGSGEIRNPDNYIRTKGQYAVARADVVSNSGSAPMVYLHDGVGNIKYNWSTLYSCTAGTNATPNAGYTWRLYLPSSLFASGSAGKPYFRVKFEAGTGAFYINGVRAHRSAASGDVYDFETTPVSVTYNDSEINTTIPSGGSLITDAIPVEVPSSGGLVVSFYIPTASNAKANQTADGKRCFYKSGNDINTVNASGYTENTIHRTVGVLLWEASD